MEHGVENVKKHRVGTEIEYTSQQKYGHHQPILSSASHNCNLQRKIVIAPEQDSQEIAKRRSARRRIVSSA